MKQLLAVLILIFIVSTGLTCKDRARDSSAVQPEGEQSPTREDLGVKNEQDGEGDQKSIEEDLLIEQARKAFENKDLDGAIALYTQALSSSTNPAELHYNIGLCYGHKVMLAQAISEFKKAISIEPNHIKALNNLGLAYERKGLLDQALPEYKKALTINPDDPQTHYNIARVYLVRRRQDPTLLSLSADHYFRAGVLFLEQENETWAIMAYNGLKQTNVTEREQALYNQFDPELQQRVDNRSLLKVE